jgi:hypothetical protein
MSRICINGIGDDNTASWKSFLSTTINPVVRYLYLIGYPDDPKALWLTNHEAPVTYNPIGTFYPAVVKRDKLKFAVGLDVQSCNVTFTPSNRNFTSSLATASPLQIAANHGYDMWPVRIWKAYMPTPGDCNTIGAVEWYAGLNVSCKVGRSGIIFNTKNLMYLLNQKLPGGAVEVTNSLAGNTAVQAPPASSVPVFMTFQGSTEATIYGDALTPNAGHIYGTGDFDAGYMVFLDGPGATLAGAWVGVGSSLEYTDGHSNNHNQFNVYNGLPWPPTPGVDKFYVSTKIPIDPDDEGSFGFPWVPDPENAA